MKVLPFRTRIVKLECPLLAQDWLRAVWLIIVIFAATFLGFALLVGILMLITRPAHAQVSFPQHPVQGEVFKNYIWFDGTWYLQQKQCSSATHFHPKGMDTSQPDVKGAPNPKADSACHSDKTDKPVVQVHIYEETREEGRKP